MEKIKKRNEEKITPFLLKFKEPLQNSFINYHYDETKELNMIKYKNQYKVAVLMPGSLALLKTLKESGGED